MTITELFGRGYSKPLHRYLMSRLSMPKRVDDLARRVHARLFTVDPATLDRRPLQCLYGLAGEEVLPDASDAAAPVDTAAAVLPENQADRLRMTRQLDVALAQLPPLQAAILLAYKRDGLSYEELQVKFGLPVPVIEKCITHAKAQVRIMSWKDGAH